MNDKQPPQAARVLFFVVRQSGKYAVYRNNLCVRFGLMTETAANTICESKARTYSHDNNKVMRQSTYAANDVGPREATVGQTVWVMED